MGRRVEFDGGLGGTPVLVVGGTGFLGRQVVDALLSRGKEVRALVRPGSDAAALEALGVEVARGDMMDPASLEAAMEGVGAVVTSAAGYTRRKKGDTSETDVIRNRNLAEAAKRARVGRFVFTGILNAHQAREVPHFWHKKLAEDRLEELGIPFVSLRPGAFLDQMTPVLGRSLPKGRLWYVGSARVRMTYVLSGDVARYLAEAVDAPGIEGERIDVGWEDPVSADDLARLASGVLGRSVHVRAVPWRVLGPVLGVAGRFSGQILDLKVMVEYFQSGRYVADPARQQEVFGGVPGAGEGVRRWLEGAGSRALASRRRRVVPWWAPVRPESEGSGDANGRAARFPERTPVRRGGDHLPRWDAAPDRGVVRAERGGGDR